MDDIRRIQNDGRPKVISDLNIWEKAILEAVAIHYKKKSPPMTNREGEVVRTGIEPVFHP